MADCKKKVGTGTIVYPCVIEIPEGRTAHDGPCKAVEVASSVSARDRWEKGGEARAVLGATQSQPMTFAQTNQAHASTPVPGSHLQPAAYREAHQPKVGDFGEQQGESCLHPFAALRAEPDGSSFCQDCGTLLQPPKVAAAQAPPASQSTLGTFVQQHEQTADIPSLTLAGHPEMPTVEIGSYVPVALDESQPSFVSQDTAAVIVREQVSAVPTKQREGDQALPVEGNHRPAVQDLIIEAMHESKRVGTERYGQPLKPMNGRDTLLDAQEEARDLYVYLTALGEERKEISAAAEEVWTSLHDHFGADSPQVAAMRKVCLWLRGTPQT